MKTAFFCLLTGILSACGTVRQVDYDYDRSVAFEQLRTFAWMPQAAAPYKDSRYRNEIIESNIKTYIGEAFIQQGLKLDKENPDILLSYDLQIEKGEYSREEPIYAQQPPMAIVNPMVNNFAHQPVMNLRMWNHPMNFMGWNQPMMGGMWWPPAPQIVGYRTRQIPFKNGTLVVSAHKRSNNRLIWRGWAESCILDPVEYKRNLEDKTLDLVSKYPLRKSRAKD
jgi:hypothetical protein